MIDGSAVSPFSPRLVVVFVVLLGVRFSVFVFVRFSPVVCPASRFHHLTLPGEAPTYSTGHCRKRRRTALRIVARRPAKQWRPRVLDPVAANASQQGQISHQAKSSAMAFVMNRPPKQQGTFTGRLGCFHCVELSNCHFLSFEKIISKVRILF